MGPLGLAALTVLDTPPVGQIQLAEENGFDMVGIRLLPPAPGGRAYRLHEDNRALTELTARLADSRVTVFDVEIVRIGADFDPGSHRRMLEVSVALGARAVLTAGDDWDRARLTASYAEFAGLCAEYGLRASLEFMPWTAVPDASCAMQIVGQATGSGRSILVDALHFARSDTSLEDIEAIPQDWLHYAQLCDGSVPPPPTNEELVRQARTERLVPGEGGIDLAGLWARLPDGLPVSIELPNEPLRRAMGTGPWLQLLAARARGVGEGADREKHARMCG